MDKEWTYETIYTECQGLGEDEVERKLEENAGSAAGRLLP